MSLTDPVADMLTRIRNACSAGHRRVDMPVSKLKAEVARLLRDNHYIADFKVLDDGGAGVLRLYLKYHNELPVIRELRRVSTPGLRRYVKCRELPRVKNGLGMAIVSTPKGLMTDREARSAEPGRRAARRRLVGGAMSRIGKKPVTLPKGVAVEIQGNTVAVKGPKGELRRTLHSEMQVAMADGQVTVARPSEEKRHKALHGLSRTLVQNMVDGVSKGFSKTLEIQGVGYKAEAKPYGVNLIVGYSHPVKYEAPKGIKISVENNTVVKIEGADKEPVGQVAAELRSVRPPEPYKGKGIRYQGEQVRRKAGKTGAK